MKPKRGLWCLELLLKTFSVLILILFSGKPINETIHNWMIKHMPPDIFGIISKDNLLTHWDGWQNLFVSLAIIIGILFLIDLYLRQRLTSLEFFQKLLVLIFLIIAESFIIFGMWSNAVYYDSSALFQWIVIYILFNVGIYIYWNSNFLYLEFSCSNGGYFHSVTTLYIMHPSNQLNEELLVYLKY